MKSFFAEFKKFALRGNVVDLAVGVVIGAAFTAVTNSLVTNIITPPIGWLIGGIDFSSLGITVGGDVVIGYGLFIEAVVNFILTAFALFLLIRFINRLTVLARKEEEAEKAAEEEKTHHREIVLLEEIRDALVKKEPVV
ncbi:MAG TPA: large conductance mechanosensitive channel protein MscL [Candidatus Paceibacterota bacterium]|jgi:large conductance mechanosensitive channel